MIRKKSWKFRLFFIICYLLFLFIITFVGRTPALTPTAWLTPFGSFHRALAEHHTFIFWGLVANFMMMLPLGLLLAWGKGGWHLWQVLLCSAALSLAIETAQYFTRLGYFDVDDLLTNVWGAAAGGGICRSMWELLRGAETERGPRWGIVAAGTIPFIAFLIFFLYFWSVI